MATSFGSVANGGTLARATSMTSQGFTKWKTWEKGKFFTREEVATHNTLEDLWVIVDTKVYDITKWIPKHPGGQAPLTYAGQDASEAFHKIHNKDVLSRHPEYIIGFTSREREEDSESPGNISSVYDVKKDPMGYDLRKSGQVEGKWGAEREFGDRMAMEGEVSALPSIMALVYLMLFAWSWLAYKIAGCPWWSMLAFYVAGMIGYYAWHRMAHQSWSGRVHQVHMRHHLLTFPPADFYGDAETFANMYPDGQPTIWSLMKIWKSANAQPGKTRRGSDQAIHLAPLIAMMAGVLASAYFWFHCNGLTLLFALIMYAVVAIVGNAIHMSFHVRGFHLEKYKWFLQLRALHYIHHLGDMNHDFAMVSMYFDWVFGSLKARDPASDDCTKPLLA